MKAIQVIAYRVIVIILLVLLFPGQSRGEQKKTAPGDIILGAKAGYSMIAGPYQNRFTGSYNAGVTLSYGNLGIVNYLMGEMDVYYSRFPMKESSYSLPGMISSAFGPRNTSPYLETVSVALGPLAYYPVVQHFQVYTGVSAIGSYTHYYSRNMNHNGKSLKPGLLVKAGFFFPVRDGFRFRAGVEYSLLYLSGKPLHGLNFIGGLSYNFNPEETAISEAPAADPAMKIDWYLTMAGNALRKGNTDEAKENYTRVLVLDRNNREAREQLAGITKAEEDYARALALAGQKRYYDALPLLDSAGKYLPAAQQEQEKIRKHLSADTALLEKQGIELYEKGDYRGCITIMNRLLLIDPKNRVGLIYLPRAVKRQGALERLR